MMTLKREDLLEVARSFEEADRLLRRAQIRAAVRRAFLVGSAQYKSELKRKAEGDDTPKRLRTRLRMLFSSLFTSFLPDPGPKTSGTSMR